MRRLAVVTVGFVFIVLGCDRGKKEGAPDKAPPPLPVASAPSEVASVGAGGPVAAQSLTEEDFEDEAERRINAQNIEAELDALDKEIQEK
jgi:hypothetical protein